VSEGKRRYHAVTFEADKRFRNRWGARINYTWSRTDDNVAGEVNAFSTRNGSTLDSYDLDSGYGRSITDTPHRLNVSGIVELPLGLTFSATGYFQSGFPIAMFQGLNNTGLLGDLQRPNVAEGVAPGHEGSTEENLGSYLNRAAWTQAPAFTFGSSPRTDPRVRTPARHNWDVALQKNLSIGTGSLLLRVEVINLFDHADFSGPVTNFSSPNFGKILNVGGFPRLAQFTVRYQW
jgi:hypothetical protein